MNTHIYIYTYIYIYIYILVLTPSNFWMGFCWSSCLLDLVSMLRSQLFSEFFYDFVSNSFKSGLGRDR